MPSTMCLPDKKFALGTGSVAGALKGNCVLLMTLI
jgi:hypothetical protein